MIYRVFKVFVIVKVFNIIATSIIMMALKCLCGKCLSTSDEFEMHIDGCPHIDSKLWEAINGMYEEAKEYPTIADFTIQKLKITAQFSRGCEIKRKPLLRTSNA
jgi:hypothetical protein